MLNLYSNRLFQVTLAMTFVQQCLIVISTYMLLQSSKALAESNLKLVVSSVILFFMFLILAYIPGAAINYYLRKAQNSIYGNYVNNVYNHFINNPLKNTLQNQKIVHNWLTGEAKSTIELFCFYVQDSVSVVLSIVLNLTTIIFAIGTKIGVPIIISLILGVIFTWFFKHKIESNGNMIQEFKNKLFIAMDKHIDQLTALPQSTNNHKQHELNMSLNNYFAIENRNALLEASIPLMITIFTISSVIYSLLIDAKMNLVIISVLVVALPRLLQIFQYIHHVIGYFQQYLFLRNKNKNLIEFCSKIEAINPMQLIKFNKINIYKDGALINYEELIAVISKNETGLYTIVGVNGSGKSMLLKLIKSKFTESVLITPDNHRNLGEHNLSSGQNMRQLLNDILSNSVKRILLLDEWDGNLDNKTKDEIGYKIRRSSTCNLIVEIKA